MSIEINPTLFPPSKKKVHIETWGCQMNTADSETILAQLHKLDYELTNQADDADLVVLNTCHIREKAKHKVLSRLGVLKDIRNKNPRMTIAVAGCVAQAEGKKLIEKAPQIDILFGPGKIHELPELLRQNALGHSAIALGFKNSPVENQFLSASEVKPVAAGMNPISRYVTITQGCDNFCTFCVVPYTRGREVSRLPNDIVKECETFLQDGAREITLLGQNVNSYGSDLVRDQKIAETATGPFTDLLTRVAKLPSLERLRFTTSNPHDFTKPLADLFASIPALGRYIHLPVQSGDDTILEKMRRKVRVQEYLEKIGWLRAIDQDFAISTDIIVGFPGETDEQFENTMKLVTEMNYSFIFSFKYSPRKNTAAFRFGEQVSEEVKSQRLARLNAIQDKVTLEQQLGEVGKTREVLFAYGSKREPGIFYGRTPQFRLVRVREERNIAGKMLQVKIVDANKTALIAELI